MDEQGDSTRQTTWRPFLTEPATLLHVVNGSRDAAATLAPGYGAEGGSVGPLAINVPDAVDEAQIDTTSGHRFWVHGNATEHFFEHFTGSLKRSCLDKARIATQVHLKSFEAALDKLAKQGYEFDKLYLVDGWEIKIGQRSVVSTDKNPQVYHARYIGE